MRTTALFSAARAAARRAILVAAIALPTFLGAMTYAAGPAVTTERTTRLGGHVLPALAGATRQPQSWTKWLTGTDAADARNIALTIVLKRDDEAGFQQYLHDVYDPASPIFRRFLTPVQIAEKFGPSQQAYDEVLAWLRSENFVLAHGSANRMTLTVNGTRADAERAFAVNVSDYEYGERTFYANDEDPSVPGELAAHVLAVNGLSTLAQPRPAIEALICGKNNGNAALNKKQAPCRTQVKRGLAIFNFTVCGAFGIASQAPNPLYAGMGVFGAFVCSLASLSKDLVTAGNSVGPPRNAAPQNLSAMPAAAPIDGTGQTIGLLEYDTFDINDVKDYLTLTAAAPAQIGNLSVVKINGGVASPGSGEAEVLIDIDAVMSLAPGAKVAVYEAPFGGSTTSYTTLFNAMINDGVSVISNSWASCEDQISLADAQSIDAVLQAAAASGISVFNASGDSGSTCLDGRANTISVPANSPHATAVGGTSSPAGNGIGFTYTGETWWDGSSADPPTGQGGFGLSKFFARPAYQNGLNGAAMRSIPDVVAYADPEDGIVICQADDGGCPTGKLNGGTSLAAPEWAAMAAAINQAQGHNLGSFNELLYPLAASDAFHNAASMGSDFAHVGLGSPNLNVLNRLLASGTVGMPTAAASHASPYVDPDSATVLNDGTVTVAADGATQGNVRVTLRDANGYFVSGKTVTLTSDSGTAVIAPASGVTTVSDGAVVFSVTDLVAEKVTFTAADTSDGLVLPQTSLTFGVPAAAGASIVALTDTVAADGVSANTITVTLQDSLGRPTPGKQVALSHTGSSIIAAPNPGVTDASGQVRFSVTDTVQELVVYTAVDLTDDELPVPGSALTTFNAGGSDNCGSSNFGDPNITAAPGYAITPYATGFLPKQIAAGGLVAQCRGAYGLAFDAGGNLFVADAAYGNIYKFPPGGGAVGAATLLTSTPLGPLLAGLTFGKDGKFYASQLATTGNFFTGAVFEVNPTTGANVRTVASAITCASFLTTDPVSGDLFVDDSCGGGGSDNPSIWRIANPGGATPATTVYATTSGTNGGLSFAPGGTLYAIDYFGTGLSKLAGTAAATPGQRTQLSGVSPALDLLALGAQGNGDATMLVASTAAVSGGLPAGMKIFDATTAPIAAKSMLVNNAFATVNLLGPDGCLYAGMVNVVYKITNADGSCPLNFNQAVLTLNPSVVSPNPAQGTTRTFSTRLVNATVSAGAPMYFAVDGVNAQRKMVRADQNGVASFTYAGVNAGIDLVVASIDVGGTTLTSSATKVTWNSGSHATALSLNPSPLGGTSGQNVAVKAVLTDLSADPLARLSGQSVTFTLGAQSCAGSTDASGAVSCTIALPAGQIGQGTLAANFTGAGIYLASSARQAFTVLAPAAATPATTITTLAAAPNPATAGQAVTLTAIVSLPAIPTEAGRSVAAGIAQPAAATGTVVFADNGVAIGSAALNGGGQAVLVVSSLGVGTHNLVANYAGDANDAASASAPVAVTILAAPNSVVATAPALAAWALVLLALGMQFAAVYKRRREQ